MPPRDENIKLSQDLATLTAKVEFLCPLIESLTSSVHSLNTEIAVNESEFKNLKSSHTELKKMSIETKDNLNKLLTICESHRKEVAGKFSLVNTASKEGKAKVWDIIKIALGPLIAAIVAAGIATMVSNGGHNVS